MAAYPDRGSSLSPSRVTGTRLGGGDKSHGPNVDISWKPPGPRSTTTRSNGATSGTWTTDMFVEAAYRNLTRKHVSREQSSESWWLKRLVGAQCKAAHQVARRFGCRRIVSTICFSFVRLRVRRAVSLQAWPNELTMKCQASR